MEDYTMKKYIYALLILSSMHQISGAATEPHETSDVVIAPHLSLEQKKLCNNLMPFYEAMTAIPECPIALLKHKVGKYGGFKVDDINSVQKYGLLTAEERRKKRLGKTFRMELASYFNNDDDHFYPDEFKHVYFAPSKYYPNTDPKSPFLSSANWATPENDTRTVGLLVPKKDIYAYECLFRAYRQAPEEYKKSKTPITDRVKVNTLSKPEVMTGSIKPERLIFTYPTTAQEIQELKKIEDRDQQIIDMHTKVMKEAFLQNNIDTCQKIIF